MQTSYIFIDLLLEILRRVLALKMMGILQQARNNSF